ncbi:hypothetical protein B0H14DRAFT_2656904 [Mycena olivaceomarginata]|nr:hypothetical protein B0H14DRAFT_2656904 [Mycena olivaceomarginata]
MPPEAIPPVFNPRINCKWNQSVNVPVIPAPPPNADAYRPMNPPLLPPALVLVPPQPDFPHTQPRLRQQKKSAEQKLEAKFEALERLLKEQFPFDTLGDFLQVLFYNPTRSEPDPRGRTHCLVVSHFYEAVATSRCLISFPSCTTTNPAILPAEPNTSLSRS